MSNHESLWTATVPRREFGPLVGSVDCDCLVIGGGIAGLMCALQLQSDGHKVVVVESGKVGFGVTGGTTAKLTLAHGAIYGQLGDAAKDYAEANRWGMNLIRDLVDELTIDCDFEVRDMIVFAENSEKFDVLTKEYTKAEEIGIPVEWVNTTTAPVKIRGGIKYTDQYQFHPLKFLWRIVDHFVSLGGVIYEDTRAYEVKEEEPCRVHTMRGTVTANKVVVATNFPVYDPALYSARLAPYRDYAIAVQIDGDMPAEMSIGASDSSYSFRTHGDLVIVSGEMHKVGQADTAACFNSLEAYAMSKFTVKSVPYKWSTQDCMSLDRMPYIGHISSSSKNVFVATGFSGWGMSTSAYAGKIIADLVADRENPWAGTFDPHRWQSTSAIKTFVKENFNVAQRWFGDKIWNQQDADIDALEPGEAAILPLDGEKVAAFRDADGTLHAVSPVCTHLGCDLAWNSAEQSWDCPCHGSRFDFLGQVLQGPAVEDLKKFL